MGACKGARLAAFNTVVGQGVQSTQYMGKEKLVGGQISLNSFGGTLVPLFLVWSLTLQSKYSLEQHLNCNKEFRKPKLFQEVINSLMSMMPFGVFMDFHLDIT